MDDYGCCEVNKADAEFVKKCLLLRNSVVFPLSSGDGGAMIILLAKDFSKVGTMPFGGNPMGRIYMGIYGRACNHFAPSETHWGYFAEKLKIPQVEAEALASFWYLMWE